MTLGRDSKRAQQRKRGRQKAELKLLSARQACRSYPVFLPLSPPMEGPGAARPAGIVLATLQSPLPASVQPSPRHAPVAGRVRLALAPVSLPTTTRPLIAPAKPLHAVIPSARPDRLVVDLAAIKRQQQARHDRERRRSMAAMLTAALGIGSLVAFNPFEPAPAPTANRQQIAVLKPPGQSPLPEPSRVVPATARPEALPEEPIAAVTQPPVTSTRQPPAVSRAPETVPTDPSDGHLTDGSRLAPPQLATLPPAHIPEQPVMATVQPPATIAPAPQALASLPPQMAFAPSAPAVEAILPPVTARETQATRLPTMPDLATPTLPSRPLGSGSPPAPLDEATPGLGFEQRLVLAAHELTRIPGGYDPKYMKIAYPMGDVPEGMGVCSDVIVRAYRGLGIDLQELVHQSKLGTGDTNVDHRRVTVLMRFFQKYGESLPVSPFPESYKPGDIVAYDVPWGRTSKWHIAVVTDQLSASLRPMVVHNRGYGAKLEDALFHKRIIGHYRFHDGSVKTMANRQPPSPATVEGKPSRRLLASSAPRRS